MVSKTATLLVLVLLAIAGPASADSREARLAAVEKAFGRPVMWVAKPETPPVIDGKLDDAVWKRARPVVLGFLTARWDMPTQRTEARVLADQKAIYFAVRCAEAGPERMVSAGSGRDGALWSGDTVEFFLDAGHKSKRFRYAHIIINPKGLIYDSKNKNKGWNANLSVKTGTFAGGWTVELAVPMNDLGVADGVPKVWGLNINRQRLELGVVSPTTGITSTALPLKDPSKYREGEDMAWSPTYSEDSHIAQCFGHAVLEVGTVAVKPPEKLFEVIYRNDFDDGKTSGWSGAKIVEDSFRGPGKCLAPKDGKGAIQFTRPLTELDDVTLIMTLKMPNNGRLYYYGRAPDNEQCDANRHEIYMTREQADRRKFPALHDYDTHGSMMASRSHGRLRKVPGSWAMMTGHFSEPSIGSVMSPGTDWVIVRTRPGQFRRQRSQGMVPISQNYPRGLTFATGSPYMIDDFILFRGMDLAGPEQVSGAAVKRAGKNVVVSWNRAKDNTLAAYYEILADKTRAAQTHRLSARLPAAKVAGKAVTIVAYDLYGNASKPSRPVPVK